MMATVDPSKVKSASSMHSRVVGSPPSESSGGALKGVSSPQAMNAAPTRSEVNKQFLAIGFIREFYFK